MSQEFPELRHGEGSWVITTSKGPRETFSREAARTAHRLGLEVRTITQHLASLNAPTPEPRREG